MADAYGSIASNPTEITLGATVTDNIATSSDVDYFKLPQASSLSKLTLDFTGLGSTTNDNEFKISVRNASDSVVATTTKGLSTTLNASIAADANYYIRVEKGTTTSTANYSIKAALTPTVETEGNGSVSTADRLVPNASFQGYLGSSSAADANDVDYYAFTTGPTDGKTVAITVAATASDATFYKASVVNANGTVQRDGNNNNLSKTAGSSNASLNFTISSSGNTKKGTYYLKIEANDPSSFASSSEAKNPYTITLAGTTDFNEPPSISMGGVVSGAYGTQKDSSATKTVSLNAQTKLSTLITTSDPDTKSTVNSAVKSYYIGLKDTTVGDDDIVALSQDVTSGKALTLNSNSSARTTAISNSSKGSAITITSAGDDSGITFAVLGTRLAIDLNGDGDVTDSGEAAGTVTETIKGANAGVATTVGLFSAVTSITSSAAAAGKVTAGVDNSGRIAYDSDGGGKLDTVIGGKTSTGAGFFKEITATQFATAQYVGSAVAETNEQTIFAAVIDNSGSTVTDISTSGVVTQKFNTQSVSLTAVDGNAGTALKEGTAPGSPTFGGGDGSGYHTITFTLDSAYSDSTNNVRVKITPKNADGSTSNDLTLGGADVSNSIITLTASDKVDKLIVSGTADGSVEGSETVSLHYEVLSDNSAYNGLVMPATSFTINEVKASFTASAMSFDSTAAPANTLRYDGISNAAQVNQNANLAINGDMASAAGSGFTTPQRVAITSAANDAGSSVDFKITGTSDGSTSQTETIDAGAAGKTVYSTKAYKTITEIKVLNANTQGNVSAGIASVLEASSYSAAQAGTYTVTAADIPVSTGAAPLVLNLTSPGVTAVFDYGLANQAVSREFMVDDNKLSVESGGAVTGGSLTMVGGTTVTLGSPTYVTVKSWGDDSANKWWITGKNANNQTVTDKITAGNNSTVTSTHTFKTVDSIILKNGGGSAQNTAGKAMAGVTDEGKAYTVTVFASQDSTDELNPHNVAIKHAIYQNDAVAQAYIGEIADKTIAVQDVNLPVAADKTVQMAKNASYTFKTADFGYSDADGDAMTKVKITTLEAAGALKYNSSGSTWNDVTLNQEIAVADIGKLKFTPATDAEGSGYGNFKFMVHDGLSYSANAATMKVNVGDSVQTTIKYFAQNTSGTAADQLIKNATIIMKDSGGNAVYAGAYTTNSSGVVDFTGVTDGAYSMSFTVTDAVKDSAINATDVSAVLDISTKLNSSPTAKQKVSADTNGDGVINATDVSNVLDMSTNLNQGVGTVGLRDGSKADPFTDKTISIVAGNNMNFDAYIIGDLDGSYANVLASA